MTADSRPRRGAAPTILVLIAALQAATGCTKKKGSPSENAGPKNRARPAGRAAAGHQTTQAQSRPGARKAVSFNAARSPAHRSAALPTGEPTGNFSSRQVALYRLDLMGKAVGSLTQQQTVWPGRIETLEHADISMTRGAASIRIKILSRTLEKPDGTPMAFAVHGPGPSQDFIEGRV